MTEPVRVFIGYDPREAIAYHVCVQSIIHHATRPVSITPLALNTFVDKYRESHRDGSNTFVYSRFLVPYLCSWRGRALFLDGDMIVRDDLTQLFDGDRPYIGVSVVKRADYQTKHPTKYLGARNDNYPRKNWSSVMLWECSFYPNRVLTPEYVAKARGEELHRLGWLEDHEIGELEPGWNHLVGEEAQNQDAKLLHFTIGTPCFPGYGEQEGAREWWRELATAMEPLKV